MKVHAWDKPTYQHIKFCMIYGSITSRRRLKNYEFLKLDVVLVV